VLSHWPSSPDRPVTRPLASWNVVVSLLSVPCRTGDEARAVVECRDAVGVGSGASGDATGGVVKDAAAVLRVGGKRQKV